MKPIIPIVMNQSFVKLAPIDNYISFIWTTRYYEAGDFELVVNVNPAYMQMFVHGNYIIREDDENVGIIEHIVIQRNEDAQEILIVTGRFLVSMLGRRIIAVQTTLDTTLSNAINTLINDNVISPSISARTIPNFILGSYTFSTNIEAQYTGKNLLDTISALCKTYGIGMKITLNSLNKFVFTLYQGVDHTYNQNVRPYIIFSDKYDNLLSAEYEENYQELVNAVLVAGEGEGLERKTAWVGETSGLDRYELYADSRNTRSNDGEISDAEYEELLKQVGREKLTKFTAAFTGTVYFDNIKYKEDVNVGDLCVIQNTRWGIYLNTRLVEVIESVAETGDYSIVPTFGL